MKKIIKAVFFLVFVFILASCGKKKAVNDVDRGGNSSDSTNSSAKIVVEDGRKIIYDVRYSLEAKDINEYQKKIETKLAEYEGYIESMETRTYYSTVTYRIKKASLDDFVNYIDSFDGAVEDKSIKTTDVSTTYNSKQARKTVLEASRASYLAMLSQDDLTISDVIAIQDKIERIDIELEQIYLDIDTYDGLIEYSTVTVSYYEKGEYSEPSFIESYGKYIGEFFITIGKVILYLLPFALLGGVTCLIVFGTLKSKKKKRLAKQKEQENNSNNIN